MGTRRTAYVLPWTVQLGMILDLTRWLEVGAEWRTYAFRQTDEQRAQVDGIDLLDELVVPRNYTDSYHLGGGVKAQPPWAAGLELMLGLHHDVSPAMDDYVSVEQPSFDHVGLRCGVRYRVGPRLRLAAAYVRYWYEERRVERSVATPRANFVADGVNDIVSLVLELCLGGGCR